MKISVFGMGYVGCVSAAGFANEGHEVIGIDIDPIKVLAINEARSPVVEPGLQEFIERAVSSGRLSASSVPTSVSDVSVVCVGTPSNENGSLNLDYILRVAEQIGTQLKHTDSYHVVNIRSTVLPGSIETSLIPIIEQASQKKAGADFGVCMNPEFMREGSSIHDFYHPPFSIIGELDARGGDVIAELYGTVEVPVIRTSIKTAEMLKYACNAFHALKVSFANEIGNICKCLGIDSHELMDIFCQDTKLNLSPYYLKPGFAFGGSCLPKDVRALLYEIREHDLESAVLNSILRSNRKQIDIAYRLIKKTGKKKVGVFGLSFKAGSDDLRESPIVELVEKLIGKGYELAIFDKEVSVAKIFGSNKRYVDRLIPHISVMIKESAEEVIDNSEVLLVFKDGCQVKKALSKTGSAKIIVDLVRFIEPPASRDGFDEEICW